MPYRTRSRSLSRLPSNLAQSDAGESTVHCKGIQTTVALLDDLRTKQLETACQKVLYTSKEYTVCGSETDVDPPTTLCKPCRLLMENPPQHLVTRMIKVVPPPEFWRSHHDSLFQLIDCCYAQGRVNEEQSCRLCHVVWQGIRRQLAVRRANPKLKGRLEIENDPLNPSMDYLDGLKVCIIYQRLEFNLPLAHNTGRWPARRTDRFYLVDPISNQYLPRESSPEDRTPMFASLSDSTGSPQAFAQIETWMQKCIHEHQHCNAIRTSGVSAPTRLLKIDDDCMSITLVDGKSVFQHHETSTGCRPLFEPYVALSYRWGSAIFDSSAILNSGTEQSLRSGLALSRLPRTIYDAVTITKSLGYSLLWVDRLCIIQDSKEDWSNESMMMTQIYQHASLVIAASSAAADTDGCIRDRRFSRHGITPLRFKRTPLFSRSDIRSKTDGQIFAAKESCDYWKKLGHLESRGWTYQERVAPTRVLYFGEEQVHWDCHQLEASELWPEGQDDRLWRPTLVRDSCGKYTTTNLDPRVWQNIVEGYSYTVTTFTEDRLWALAGLAQWFRDYCRHTVRDEQYYAGLWKSSLLSDMGWRLQGHAKTGPLEREQYIAPSWSWASIQAPVFYTLCSGTELGAAMLTVKDIQLRYANRKNQFGAVVGGFLYLHGQLLRMRLAKRDPEFWDDAAYLHDHNGGEYPPWDLSMDWDVAPPWSACEFAARSVEVFCVPMSNTRDNKSVQCVVVARNGIIEYENGGLSEDDTLNAYGTSIGKFQRIGRLSISFWIHEKGWDMIKEMVAKQPKEDFILL